MAVQSHNLEELQKRVIQKSRSDRWDRACTEWDLVAVWRENDGECLCGKRRISTSFKLENPGTGHQIVVGSGCATRFDENVAGLSTRILQSLRALISGKSKTASDDLVEMALAREAIDDNDAKIYRLYRHYQDVVFKRVIAVITGRILNSMFRQRACDDCFITLRVRCETRLGNLVTVCPPHFKCDGCGKWRGDLAQTDGPKKNLLDAAEARAGQTHGVVEEYDPIADSTDEEETQSPGGIITTTTNTSSIVAEDPDESIKLSSLIRKRRPLRRSARRCLIFENDKNEPIPVTLPEEMTVIASRRQSKRLRRNTDHDYVPPESDSGESSP